ncbi:MAG: cupredoxin domain-containing protein [Actinomycetota bacterium]|nr:cupredoxin domain-containing protein [Actinomycetota bacterium]
MHKKGLAAVALALALALLMAACGGGNDNSSSSGSSSGDKEGGTITIQGQSANDHGTMDAAGASSVEVEIDDYYFEPTVITGTAGEKVTLELKNEGSATHTFTLPSEKIDEQLSPGDSKSVQVTIPKSGTALFFCKFHASMGMRGGLEVSS